MKIRISQDAAKFVGPSSPREVRLMAARGTVPLSPRDVIKILYILCHDKDDGIRGLAAETLKNYSPKIVENLLSGDIEPEIIDYLVRHHNRSHLFVDKALQNKNISDETLTFFASGGNVKILEVMALNHERLLRSRGVLFALLDNTAVGGALRQSLLELADPSVRQRGVTGTAERGPFVAAPAGEDEPKRDEPGSSGASSEPDASAPSGAEEREELDEGNLAARVGHLNVAEKIKYATRGNKETRAILLKDSSKIVVAAVIKSPKISEDEILKIAQNKQANDEAIRLISLNKEWLKNYSVRLALVNNPKTPTGIAVRLMAYVTKRDLKDIAASRNVPSVISANAKKLMAAKDKST